MSERDIVETLRAPAYWMSGSNEGHEGENDAPRQAADEIDRLRAMVVEAAQLSAENARLRAASLTETLRAEVARLAAENEKLRAALLKAQSFIRGEHAMMKAYFSLHDEGVPVRECDVRHMQRMGKLADELDAVLARTALQEKSDESGEGKGASEGEKE